MALRRCWRFGGCVPRLLCSSVPPRTYSLVGGGRFVNTYQQGYKSTELQLRRFSSQQPRRTEVSYDQLKKLLSEQKTVVIDVREPWELREYGFIRGSINVPLGQMNTALQLDPEEFREKYDGEKPLQTDNIVFICLAGVRSKTALNTAASLGYKDITLVDGMSGQNVNNTSNLWILELKGNMRDKLKTKLSYNEQLNVFSALFKRVRERLTHQ